jgi:geranylgeranyl diphosphate synthase type II
MAYQLFENYEPNTFQALAKLFSKTALEVCEGQQYDIDFETKIDVSVIEYIKMITFKTAVLLASALKMGAIIAKANEIDANHIYNFGLNLGIAFQLQDDYLDVFGDPKTFGKQIGGDILENKKTFLYLNLLKLATKDDKNTILKWFSIANQSTKKIKEITLLYNQYKIPKLIKNEINKYTNLAFESLDKTSISKKGKRFLKQLGVDLFDRAQ